MTKYLSGVLTTAAALSLLPCAAFAQDECTSATALAIGANGPFSNAGFTVSAPAWSCSFVSGADVWFSFATPALAGSLTIDTEGTVGLDTVLEVFDACGGNVIACDDDGGTGLLSTVTFMTAGGTTYFARVGGFGSATGSFLVNVAFSSPDECTGAIPITAGLNGPFSNVGATNSAPAFPCATANSDIWFRYTAPCNGSVTINTCAGGGTLIDTVMQAFDACGGTSLACNDDSCGLRSQVTFAVTGAANYFIRVGDFGTVVNQGTFSVTVNLTPAPGVFPDNCECAQPIALGPNAVTTVGSTVSSPPWSCSFVTGGDTWYSYTVAGPGCVDLTFNTAGSGVDTVLEVWDSCGGTVLACDDDALGFPPGESEIVIPATTAGTMYLVRAARFASSTSAFTLNVSETPSIPANDDCAGALPIAIGANGPYSTSCATVSAPAWPCAFNGGPDLWFSFTAACTGPHTFNTCGSDYDTALQVFDACGGTSLGCNDDAGATGPCAFTLQSSLTLNLTSGATYLVRVGGFNGATGNATLNVTTGTNTGSAVVTTPSLCPTTATIALSGSYNIGTSFSVDVNNAAGFPFIGLGLAPALPLPPPCGCFVISNGAGGLGTFVLSSSLSIALPCDPSFIGQQFDFQGLDGFPAAGGCFFVIPFGLTDIVTVTIG